MHNTHPCYAYNSEIKIVPIIALFIRIITAAMIPTMHYACGYYYVRVGMHMHIGYHVPGIILFGVNARKKRFLGAMMKKRDR